LYHENLAHNNLQDIKDQSGVTSQPTDFSHNGAQAQQQGQERNDNRDANKYNSSPPVAITASAKRKASSALGSSPVSHKEKRAR
jgi:hypothetical protein